MALVAIAAALMGSLISAAVPARPKVGAYYYAWYGDFRGGHSWDQTLRAHLVPPHEPATGQYSSRSSEVIAAHIDQSRKAMIDFWAVSWWGPDSADDETLRQHLLAHSRMSELEWAIHYESTGRLGKAETPRLDTMLADFRYLAKHYFHLPNYLKIDKRPVVFLYVAREYFNTPAARGAVAELRRAMKSEFGYDPFLVGDDVFTEGVVAERARLWDAITNFDIYGTVLQQGGSTTAAVQSLRTHFDRTHAAAAALDVGFIPTATPGFNDRAVRRGHAPATRYFTDDPQREEGALFRRILAEAVVPHVDPRVQNIFMVNSFNEWHEDTQIEAAAKAKATTDDDSGDNRYTTGHSYAGYGELYLELLRKAAATPLLAGGDVDGDGDTDFQDFLRLQTNLGKAEGATRGDGDLDGDGDVDAQDYSILRGYFEGQR